MSTEAQDVVVALDKEYGAVCSQLGVAFLELEAVQARLAKLKAQREDVIARFQAAQRAQATEETKTALKAVDGE